MSEARLLSRADITNDNDKMKRQTLLSLIALTVFGVASARADVVTDWNNAALDAIRVNRTPPPRASRTLAMLHVSIYDAVNGISRTHEPYLVRSTVPASASARALRGLDRAREENPGHSKVPASASKEAAASAAAHLVLSALFPTNTAAFDALHARTLAGIRTGPQKRMGIVWGQKVGSLVLAARADDGSDATVAPPPALGPGDWVPTPPAFAPYLLPQWGDLTPFTMSDHAQVRPPGPPALDSAAYATAFNEIKALGAAVGSTRTADQSQIALFWADGAGTETPPGHWNHIAQDVGAAQGNTMEENARLFALLNLAMADAAICAWDAKYTFHNWRPVTAIRMADLDGNPDTAPDPAWASFIVTPPFPDYVSGHSTFSGSAATVLAMFYGTDDISFTSVSDFLPGVTRSFTSFSSAAMEAMNSRLYGGIHYRFANEDGLASGLEIGQWAFTHYLQPKGNRSRQ